MSENASFGNWLRRRRKALDLTLQQLAGRVGCAVSTLVKIENEARRRRTAAAPAPTTAAGRRDE